jgi:hypothetical protein
MLTKHVRLYLGPGFYAHGHAQLILVKKSNSQPGENVVAWPHSGGPHMTRPASPDVHVNFDAPAILRKWPSLNNQRRTTGIGPYLLFDGTLDECIREFMAKPAPMRHLYEIHTSPQPPLVGAVLSGDIVAELARLRDFL